MVYTLFMTGENPAGTSKTVVQNISFQNCKYMYFPFCL